MYGLNKYTGPGCYRFLNDYNKIVYIGMAKNIDRRLMSHFKGKGSNLNNDEYKSIAKIDICKTTDYPTALALEQYLINKYKPKYNKKDKSNNINSKVVSNEEYYEGLEHWKLYHEFMPFKEELGIKPTKFGFWLAVVYLIAILSIVFFINHK